MRNNKMVCMVDTIISLHNLQEKYLMMYVETYLVRIKFYIYHWHPLIHFGVVSDHAMNSLGDILKYQVKIELIFFGCRKETMLQSYNIRVVQKAHCLQFPVLVPLVLKNLLYSHSFTCLQALCLHNKWKKNTITSVYCKPYPIKSCILMIVEGTNLENYTK
jgi:hypothetical protein